MPLVVGLGLIGWGLWERSLDVGQGSGVGEGKLVRVQRVSDGDTVTLEDGRRLRLCGIDAPEKAQPLGKESGQFLRELVVGKLVRVTVVERDRYGRSVAEVWTAEGRLVNAAMTEAGLAYVYERYLDGCPSKGAIASGQEQARRSRLGVWGREGLVVPWEWRRR